MSHGACLLFLLEDGVSVCLIKILAMMSEWSNQQRLLKSFLPRVEISISKGWIQVAGTFEWTGRGK
jgi:hypothetical protein